MKARKLLALGLTAIIGATMMAGCGGGGGSTTSQSSDGSSASGTYAFVAKDVQNPYMQKVYDGFEKACKEIGAEPGKMVQGVYTEACADMQVCIGKIYEIQGKASASGGICIHS